MFYYFIIIYLKPNPCLGNKSGRDSLQFPEKDLIVDGQNQRLLLDGKWMDQWINRWMNEQMDKLWWTGDMSWVSPAFRLLNTWVTRNPSTTIGQAV